MILQPGAASSDTTELSPQTEASRASIKALVDSRTQQHAKDQERSRRLDNMDDKIMQMMELVAQSNQRMQRMENMLTSLVSTHAERDDGGFHIHNSGPVVGSVVSYNTPRSGDPESTSKKQTREVRKAASKTQLPAPEQPRKSKRARKKRTIADTE